MPDDTTDPTAAGLSASGPGDGVVTEAERLLGGVERTRRHLAAVGANDLLDDDPTPGVALELWRGERFLLAGGGAVYDRERDLYWPPGPAGGIARSFHERHVRYGCPLW